MSLSQILGNVLQPEEEHGETGFDPEVDKNDGGDLFWFVASLWAVSLLIRLLCSIFDDAVV